MVTGHPEKPELLRYCICNYSLRFILKKNPLSFTRLVHPTQLKPTTVFLPHNIRRKYFQKEIKCNVKVARKTNISFQSTLDHLPFLIVNQLYCYCYNFKRNAWETNVLVMKLCLRKDYIRTS